MAKTEKPTKKGTKKPEKVAVPSEKKAIPIHKSYATVRHTLELTFKELRKVKLVAIMHHRADVETATATVLELIQNSKREYAGYVFWTAPDEKKLRETGMIELTVGATTENTLLDIVKSVLDACAAQNLSATWNETTVHVELA